MWLRRFEHDVKHLFVETFRDIHQREVWQRIRKSHAEDMPRHDSEQRSL